MFEDWKQAWRQAVENFHREMADGLPGTAPHIRAMERELTSASGALLRLDEEIARTRREAAGEVAARDVCLRRERLARDAGDDETVRVAAGFAARHAERAAVLERKIGVLQDERDLLARDLDQMRAAVGEAARTHPPDGSATAAATSGASPHSSLRDDGDDRAFSRLERDAQERAADERLAELKRKMRG